MGLETSKSSVLPTQTSEVQREMTCDTGNVLGLTVENPDGNSFGKVGNVPQKPMGKSCSVGASGDIAAGCTPHILL